MMIQPQFIFVDPDFVIVNKPAGLLTIPDGYTPDLPNLLSILSNEFGNIWVVHRLDKDTSGVMVFARNADIHRNLSMLFESRQVEKHYRVIITGIPPWNSIMIRYPLRTNGDRRHRTRVDLLSGKSAQTHCQLVEKLHQSYLIDAAPKTGYTHQIRAHLSTIGYPILADALYKSHRQMWLPPNVIERPALHAMSLSFSIHGVLKEYSAPYPDDFIQEICARKNNEGLSKQ